MKEFQGRRRWRDTFYSKATIVILLILVFLLGRALWGTYNKNKLAKTGRGETEASLNSLEEQKEQLTEKVKWLETKRGQEEEIRQNFSVVRPGEKMVIVVDNLTSTTDASAESEEEPWWQKFRTNIKKWLID